MGKGRYTALAQPLAAPGQCFFSGEAGAAKGPYIDTGMHITRDNPKFGRVYLSRNAVTEMYRELQKFQDENPDEKTAAKREQIEADLKEKYDAGYAAGFEACRDEMKATFYAVANALGSSTDSATPDNLIDLLEDRKIDDEGAEGSEPGSTSTPVGLDADSGNEDGGGVSGDSGDEDGSILI